MPPSCPLQKLGPIFLLLAACIFARSVAAQQPGVVFEPTPHETVDRMLRLARVGAGDFVIDLGSGDGRIPIAAARNGARALGIELDPALIEKSQAAAQAAGVAGRVTFRREDLFMTPLGEATVVTLYLLPEMNERLRPRLLALRPGTRIVAHQFAIGDWKPDAVDDDGGRIFLWYVPANIAGRWQMTFGSERITLELTQRHQEFAGTAAFAGAMLPLTDTRLTGSEMEFTLSLRGAPTRFRGLVAGNEIQPAPPGFGFQAFATGWRASRR